MSWINILEVIYPVGSVYLSITPTSPASIVGGTWSKKENGCLACADTVNWAEAGQNGGSEIITEEQMPSHTHLILGWNIGSTPAMPSTTPYNWIGYADSSWTSQPNMMTSAGGGRHINRSTSLSTFGSELLNLFFKGVA